jgi:hypothetical protein
MSYLLHNEVSVSQSIVTKGVELFAAVLAKLLLKGLVDSKVCEVKDTRSVLLTCNKPSKSACVGSLMKFAATNTDVQQVSKVVERILRGLW